MNYDKTLLDEISRIHGVSGFENSICSFYLERLKDKVSNTQIDRLGNAYGMIKGSGSDKVIMVEAHADEIGFQVLYIAENGFIYLRRNGGIDEQCIPGSQVEIVTKDANIIRGVMGKKPIHLMTTDERKRTLEVNQLWVDTGLEASKVKEYITVGDCVSFRPNWQWLGEHRISGKSLDNKIGLYALIKAMESIAELKIAKSNVVGVATVQEEVGSRGVRVAGYNLNPDIAITVDMDFATDVPDCPFNKYGKIELGRGVVIPCNVDCDIELSRTFEKIAKENGISYQLSARPHATGGTNTSQLQLVRGGVKTISLGIPCRYMHTPVEVCDMRDVHAAIQLLSLFCSYHE